MTEKPTYEELEKKIQKLERLHEALQTKNEEYKAINEELKSSVVELQTATEKLQVQNEKQQQAEAALSVSEERYHRITEGLTDYFYTCLIQNGKVVETIHRPACEAVTGYSVEDFANDPYLWIQMVVPEDCHHVLESIQIILSGKHPQPIEHRIIKKNGQVRWVIDTPILNLDSQGTLVSYDGVIKDITVRKRAEEVLLEKEKLQGVLEMAGAICHEINQPLQVVSGFSEILLIDLESSDPKYKALKSIEANINRIGILMRKISGITHYQSKSYLKGKIVDIEEASQHDTEDINHD
jgi:PAS domain S-box-containing protein